MKLTNARLRDQLAGKEETHHIEVRASQSKANEMGSKIQELLLAQTNFNGVLAEKDIRIEDLQRQSAEAERHRIELMSQQTLKSDNSIRVKDLEVEERARGVSRAQETLGQLNSQLTSQQDSVNYQVRSLEDETNRLNEALDHAKAQLRLKQEQLETHQATLAKVKKGLEDEANQVGVFVSKSLNAIKLAKNQSKDQGAKGKIVLTSKSNLGFAELTIQQVI